MIEELLRTLQQHGRVCDEVLAHCMAKTRSYLETIDADKTIMESYMSEYYSEMARSHRANSRLSVTLSAIAKQLTAIEEEEEPEEQESGVGQRVLASIANSFSSQLKKVGL